MVLLLAGGDESLLIKGLIVLQHKVDRHCQFMSESGSSSLRAVFALHFVVQLFDPFGCSDRIEGHLAVSPLQIRIADLLILV